MTPLQGPAPEPGIGGAAANESRATGGIVKVVVMAGQSNMEGKAVASGRSFWRPWRKPCVGSLAAYCQDPRTAQLMSQACCSGGGWRMLKDVKVWMYQKDCPTSSHKCKTTVKFGDLSVGFGVGGDPDRFGPELGFGFGLSNALPGEKVLILKLAYGGSSLAVNWRPPSSTEGADPFCTENGCSKCGADFTCRPSDIGPNYERIAEDVLKALKPGVIAHQFPEFASLTPKLTGFGWDQGWSDGKSLCHAAAYRRNLVNLVRDLRAAWEAPDLPVVIAASGFLALDFPGGRNATTGPDSCWEPDCNATCACDEECSHLKIINSQFSVIAALPYTVTVETRGFWRTADESPPSGRDEPYHWHFNAESVFLVGQAMAAGLLHLLGASGSTSMRDLYSRWRALNDKALQGSVLTPEDLWPQSMAPKPQSLLQEETWGHCMAEGASRLGLYLSFGMAMCLLAGVGSCCALASALAERRGRWEEEESEESVALGPGTPAQIGARDLEL